MKKESTERKAPQKWLWRPASRLLTQVDAFPPHPYSRTAGVSSAGLAERPHTFFISPPPASSSFQLFSVSVFQLLPRRTLLNASSAKRLK
jgi:hypothetical protein